MNILVHDISNFAGNKVRLLSDHTVRECGSLLQKIEDVGAHARWLFILVNVL